MEDNEPNKVTQRIKTGENANLLREILGILFLSFLLGFSFNAFSSKGIPLIRVAPMKHTIADSELFGQLKPSPKQPPVATDTVVDSVTNKKIPVFAPLQKKALANPDSVSKLFPKKNIAYSVVNLDQIRKLLAEHRGVFLDARGADEFAEGHIIGSRNIPYLDVDKHFEEIMNIPQDTLVVIYCNGPECHLGRGLADFMNKMEFKHIYLYDDGWDGWEKAKMPFEGTKTKP
ncbi:MAG: rhodanese-like domain-containing protein [Bacteroidota bacterium]